MAERTRVSKADMDRHFLAARRRHRELAAEMGMAAQVLASAEADAAAFATVYALLEWSPPVEEETP